VLWNWEERCSRPCKNLHSFKRRIFLCLSSWHEAWMEVIDLLMERGHSDGQLLEEGFHLVVDVCFGTGRSDATDLPGTCMYLWVGVGPIKLWVLNPEGIRRVPLDAGFELQRHVGFGPIKLRGRRPEGIHRVPLDAGSELPKHVGFGLCRPCKPAPARPFALLLMHQRLGI
jgi:hypothetical protein